MILVQRFLPSLLTGGILSWFIKDEFTMLITAGKSFENRSQSVQIAILAILVVITTLLVFALLFFTNKVYRWKKKLLLLSALCLGMIFIEFFVFNGGFLFGRVLQERRYSINQGLLYQFELENGTLVAQGVDPNITFRNINIPIAAISIKCANSVPGASGQVFYAGNGEKFSEERSVWYRASSVDPILFLDTTFLIPQPVMVSSLRFDLTGATGDSLTCSEFVVNPRVPFTVSLARLLIYGGVLSLFILYAFGGIRYQQILLQNKALYVGFSVIILVIDFLYPPIFTFDSSYYFWYVDILNGNIPFENWDLVRGFIFPLVLKITTDLFGQNLLSIKILLSFFHILLFTTGSYLVIKSCQPLPKRWEKWIIFSVFVFVALDPLVLGFYHAVLTEFLASYLAVLSSLLAFLLVKYVGDKPKMFFLLAGFTLIVFIAWQLKQPYVGAGLFPLILSSGLIYMDKSHKWQNKMWLFGGNLFVLLSLFIGVTVWHRSVSGEINNKPLDSFANRAFNTSVDLIQESPAAFVRAWIKNYLALANIYQYDLLLTVEQQGVYTDRIVINENFSINRALENRIIGYVIYTISGSTNLRLSPNFYVDYIKPYEAVYYPPNTLNRIFMFLTVKSNVFFSLSYLFLPVLFSVTLLLFILNHKRDRLVIIYILSGTSLANAIAHALMYNPIDRYIFLGYPLLLLTIVIFFIDLVDVVVTHKQRVYKYTAL